MHEFALAEAVVAAAREAAAREKLTEVSELVVRVGALQQLESAALALSLETILKAEEPPLRGASVALKPEPASFRCRPCGRTWDFEQAKKRMGEEEGELVHFVPEIARSYMGCPACGSPDFEITSGRGVWIDEMTGSRE